MIPANELRVGNIVNFSFIKENVEILGISAFETNDGIIHKFSVKEGINLYCEPPRCFKPIPLTEEWLIKLGFIKLDVQDSFYIHSDFMSVKISLDLKMIAFNNLNLHQVKFDFVHHLQNLFYALISEELTIK